MIRLIGLSLVSFLVAACGRGADQKDIETPALNLKVRAPDVSLGSPEVGVVELLLSDRSGKMHRATVFLPKKSAANAQTLLADFDVLLATDTDFGGRAKELYVEYSATRVRLPYKERVAAVLLEVSQLQKATGSSGFLSIVFEEDSVVGWAGEPPNAHAFDTGGPSIGKAKGYSYHDQNLWAPPIARSSQLQCPAGTEVTGHTLSGTQVDDGLVWRHDGYASTGVGELDAVTVGGYPHNFSLPQLVTSAHPWIDLELTADDDCGVYTRLHCYTYWP